MTITDFAQKVAAYVNRDRDALVINSLDLVVDAANLAKLWAQNEADLEYCRYTVSISLSTSAGADISTAIFWEPDTSVADVAASVKKLERAFLVGTRGSTQYIGTPLRIYKREDDVGALLRENPTTDSNVTYPTLFSAGKQYVVQHGTTVYLSPFDSTQSSPVEVAFDALVYIPDYSATHVEDFFLREYRHFMFWKTLEELNAFLKEDQRVEILEKVLQRHWNNVLKHNESVCTHSDSRLD